MARVALIKRVAKRIKSRLLDQHKHNNYDTNRLCNNVPC